MGLGQQMELPATVVTLQNDKVKLPEEPARRERLELLLEADGQHLSDKVRGGAGQGNAQVGGGVVAVGHDMDIAEAAQFRGLERPNGFKQRLQVSPSLQAMVVGPAWLVTGRTGSRRPRFPPWVLRMRQRCSSCASRLMVLGVA